MREFSGDVFLKSLTEAKIFVPLGNLEFFLRFALKSFQKNIP